MAAGESVCIKGDHCTIYPSPLRPLHNKQCIVIMMNWCYSNNTILCFQNQQLHLQMCMLMIETSVGTTQYRLKGCTHIEIIPCDGY